jgi:hypothetical protein
VRATSLSQVGQEASVVFSSLANDDVAKLVWRDVREGAKASGKKEKKKVFVETSTLYPSVVGAYPTSSFFLLWRYLRTCL